MWRAHDGMGWWMVFGGVLWLAFWVFVVYAVIWVATGRRGPARHAEPAQPAPRPEDPMDIARRRYAAGEITRDEYLAIVDTLGRPADSSSSTRLGRAS
jgi:putative membrane protein